MADTKLSGLTEDTAPTSDDLVETVTDPGGTPASRKATLANLRKGILPGATSTTDNAVARYNGTAGDLQNSSVIVLDNGSVTMQGTVSADDLILNINNQSADSGSKSRLHLQTESDSDPYVTWRLGGAGQAFALGIDNSASDAFVLSRSAALGTDNVFSVDTSGNMTLLGSTALGTPASGVLTNCTGEGGFAINLGTEQASTSGTDIDFTGIPAGTKRITVTFVAVSTDGSTVPRIQLGDSGGFEATGYACTATSQGDATAATQFTNGFGLAGDWGASVVVYGTATFTLEDAAAFTWSYSFVGASSAAATLFNGAGAKSLSAELTQIRINATGNFDAGAINITYE